MRLGRNILLPFLWFLSFACPAQECGTNMPRIDVHGTKVIVESTTFKKLTPQFFGFNLEVVEFEYSLWNKKDRRVEPVVVKYLQRFPGAVFRYPGGSAANHFDWKSATGPDSSRQPQKPVGWAPRQVLQFGPAEYLDFVKEVGGTAWYILNMIGSVESPHPTQTLENSAAELGKFMGSQRSKGAPSIYRWELGNELDRGRIQWPASKYVRVAKGIAASVRSNVEAAEFIGMTQDWAHTGASELGVNYNTAVARGLAQEAAEFAAHLYYDGPPWGVPLPRRMRQFCTVLSDVRLAAPGGTMWATEHARTPLGTPDDLPAWKKNWPQTASLAAAISSADLMITLARTQNVRGAFIHSLHGTTGPWPMFHKQSDGTINPSAVYWALVLLRETLLDDVLTSFVSTTNQGANGVGYDTNAAVLADSGRSRFAVWLVNRSQAESIAQVRIPSLAKRRIAIKVGTLTGKDPGDGNYEEPYKVFPTRREAFLDVDANGTFSIALPAHSVNAANIEMAPERR